MSFELITNIASTGPDQLVTVDNFLGLVTILDDFATIAGKATESRQIRGYQNEPLSSSKFVDQRTEIRSYDSGFTALLLSLEGRRRLI